MMSITETELEELRAWDERYYAHVFATADEYQHTLIVETDGRATHDNPFAFERDRQRDLELKLAGWEVIRITWRQLRTEPRRIAALLRANLGGL